MRFNDPSRFVEEISDENLEATITRGKQERFNERQPRVLGKFKPLKSAKKKIGVDPKDFKPNAADEIEEGQRVRHLKFGEGEVLSIDERKVATIRFEDIAENPEKRIMLEYARLQIVE